MAAVSFATGLGTYLADKPKLDRWEKRLKAIIDAPPSKRRTAILNALESRVRDKLGLGDKVGIDWASIDWAAVLTFILKLLIMLAPLFLGTGGKVMLTLLLVAVLLL